MNPTNPQKPLYTARFSIIDTKYYTPAEIFGIFGPDLEKAGFIHYQTPAVKGYTPPFTLRKDSLFSSTTDPNGPFYDPSIPASEADPDKTLVYESMLFKGPDGQPFRIMRQFAPIKESNTQAFQPAQPVGSRPILDKKSPRITTVAWNLGAKAITPDIEKALITKIRDIRKSRVYNPQRETGTGFTALAHSWQNTPFKLANYPDRPPVPKGLLPTPPKPAPTPPKPAPTPPKPPPPPPKPTPKPTPLPVIIPAEPETILSKYWQWILGGGLVAFYLMLRKKG